MSEFDIGPAGNVTYHNFSSMIASNTGQGTYYSGECMFYGLTYICSADSSVNLQLFNASATGVLTPTVFQIRGFYATSAGRGGPTLAPPKPIRCLSGLAWQVTATGGATVDAWVHWSAIPQRTGPGRG